jgi:hypothetical protein
MAFSISSPAVKKQVLKLIIKKQNNVVKVKYKTLSSYTIVLL